MIAQTFVDRLLGLLIELDAMTDPANRKMLLRGLPPRLALSVPRQNAPLSDLTSILDYAGGWAPLADGRHPMQVVLENLRIFVRGTGHAARIDAFERELQTLVKENPAALTSSEGLLDRIDEVSRFITTKGSLARAQRSVRDLTQMVLANDSDEARERLIARLLEALEEDVGAAPVPTALRDLRRAMMKAVSTLAIRELKHYFSDRQLESQDVVGMDFGNANLEGISFRSAFLIESIFTDANLKEASFSRAYIRNVRFDGAVLDGADFSGADWFNAIGLTAEQLGRANRATLLPCPRNRAEFHQKLGRYVYSFDEYEDHIQKELVAAWDEYSRPGGLRDVVATWTAPGQ